MAQTPPTPKSPPLTTHLLSHLPDAFTTATQSPFLRHAASTTGLPKPLVSQWLANDRLYMQGYIKLAGRLLTVLRLPAKPTPPTVPRDKITIEERLLDWLVDALVNIRREERFFMQVAEKYGFDVDMSTEDGGGVNVVDETRKSEGLRRFEGLFDVLLVRGKLFDGGLVPWLEGAVAFWATEIVYFTAWSWAKEQAAVEDGKAANVGRGVDGAEDVNAAMRKEFIPNWTNEEFKAFVDRLGVLLDEGVERAVGGDEETKELVVQRAENVWRLVLDAEAAFWPEVDV
jgi:hypothetical protein